VRYSFPGVKVHAKLGLVRREEEHGPVLYGYLSTGNFHEETAKIYSDFGLFTADKRLTGESARLFAFLENVQVPVQKFEHLLVGQFNLRNDLLSLINQEIRNAQAGKEASMILKLNSIQDTLMISKLYEASQAGVKIQLIIRGICCLIPQMEGYSENITACSIVDRFLEHSRVFIFHNDGDEKVFLSSADWMVRNLSYRIETAFPVYDPALAARIKDLVNIQLHDNVKARIIDTGQTNPYRKGGPDIGIRSQIETYYYLKRREE
jgi:polyphosphate kinase